MFIYNLKKERKMSKNSTILYKLAAATSIAILGLNSSMFMNVAKASALDPLVSARQEALNQAGDVNVLNEKIKDYQTHYQELIDIEHEMIERLRARLTNEYHLNPMEINSVINEVKQLSEVKDFHEHLVDFNVNIQKHIFEIQEKKPLKNQDILEFASVWGGTYTALKQHANRATEQGRSNLDKIIENSLRKAINIECPKTIAVEDWKKLRDEPDVGIVIVQKNVPVTYRVAK